MAADSLGWMSDGRRGSCNDFDDEEGGELGSNALPRRVRVLQISEEKEGAELKPKTWDKTWVLHQIQVLRRTMGCKTGKLLYVRAGFHSVEKSTGHEKKGVSQL